MRLAEKKAIVTGASRGIGAAISLAFAREGADVLINYVSRDKDAQETRAAVEGLGRTALLFKGDVSDSSQVKAMVNMALAKWGRIDILVNNAGIPHMINLINGGMHLTAPTPTYCGCEIGLAGRL
jgi:hypothetical protein